MKSTERQKFEDNWKDAFEGSEMTPSDSVWSNIDLKLDNEKMKRRVVYYQRLAAASILFALLIGVGGVRYFNNADDSLAVKSNSDTKNKSEVSSTNQQSLQEKTIAKIKPDGESNASVADNQSAEITLRKIDQSNGSNNTSAQSIMILKNEQNNSVGITIAGNAEILKQYSDNSLMDTKKYLPLASQPFENLSSYNSLPTINTQFPEVAEEDSKLENKIETTAIATVLPVEVSNEKETEKKKKKTEDLWLAFGAAAGSYNPGNSAASSAQAQNSSVGSASYGFVNQAAPQSTRSSVGSAYSIGLSVGKKIADRWIIQTGVNYLSQAIDYTSNFTTVTGLNESKAALADYAGLAQANSQTLTQPYKVNSNMEFVSVPVQAGYIIIDRKVGLQLNAGIASDIFLRNTLRDESGHSSKYSQSSGGESPYRSFNWAGLASTELSYKMFKQYRISIQPGFRYSLQPSLKSESGANSNPLVLDVGFRFRYIFQ